MERPKAPADLGLKLRLAISREAAYARGARSRDKAPDDRADTGGKGHNGGDGAKDPSPDIGGEESRNDHHDECRQGGGAGALDCAGRNDTGVG